MKTRNTRLILLAAVIAGAGINVSSLNLLFPISSAKALELIERGEANQLTVLEGQDAALLSLKASNSPLRVAKISENIENFIALSRQNKLQLESRTSCPGLFNLR